MRDQIRAGLGHADVTELPVYALRIVRRFRRELMLHLDLARLLVDEQALRGRAVETEENFVAADGLRGMTFRARRRIEVPDDLFIRIHLARAGLARKEHVPVRQ